MNKKLIAPIALIAAVAIKQVFGIEFTESQLETVIEVVIELGSTITAAIMNPKKEVKEDETTDH